MCLCDILLYVLLFHKELVGFFCICKFYFLAISTVLQKKRGEGGLLVVCFIANMAT